MHIIEPALVTVQLYIFGFAFLFLVGGLGRANVARRLALPLTLDRVRGPAFREDLGHIKAVEVLHPVLEGDPPGPVNFLLLVGSLFQFIADIAVLVPLLGVVGEGAAPAAVGAPRVANLYELQVFFGEFADIQNSVKIVEKNPVGARVGIFGGFPRDRVDAPQLKFHIEVVLNGLPETLCLGLVVLFLQGNALAEPARQVHEPFDVVLVDDGLVAPVQLGVGFLKQCYPELLIVGVLAKTNHRGTRWFCSRCRRAAGCPR